MRSILIGVVLFLVAGSTLALKNGCKPGTTGCGACFQYPIPQQQGCLTDNAGFSDFDGDFSNDLLYRNPVALANQAWVKYGHGTAKWKTFSPAGMNDSNWEALATGYFEAMPDVLSGDMDADILWQHEKTGELKLWIMNFFQRSSSTTLTCPAGIPCTNPGAPWKAVATGFFGAEFGSTDGLSDILFWNSATGDLKVWIMDGTRVVRETLLNWKMPNLSWKVIATGFFGAGSEDPFSDILWFNPTNGEVRLWVMNGAQLLEEKLIGTETNLDWNAVGVVDFDRNGFPDILFRKAGVGNLRYWKMNGPNRTGETIVPSIAVPTDLTWKPVAR